MLSLVNMEDSAALQESTRVLKEEIKLAARPQIYVFVDLMANTILIKGRGVELHRIPIEGWSTRDLSDLAPIYRLRERPSVNRRKIDPVAGVEQDPISLADMPTTFTLSLSPPLRILVLPDVASNPVQWIVQGGQSWWLVFTSWGHTFWRGEKSPFSSALALTVSVDHAQSLAWTVTEGMPFLIRRPTRP